LFEKLQLLHHQLVGTSEHLFDFIDTKCGLRCIILSILNVHHPHVFLHHLLLQRQVEKARSIHPQQSWIEVKTKEFEKLRQVLTQCRHFVNAELVKEA
jgi:hypothetical protein